MPFDRDKWRALVVEEALEPELPICDAHHHLLEGEYELAEFADQRGSGHNIVTTVFVEGHRSYHSTGPDILRPVGETEFTDGLAEQSSIEGGCQVAAAIVGFADLTHGKEISKALEAHSGASSRFRGIRHAAAWDKEVLVDRPVIEGLYLDRKFRKGFACLADLRLSFDAWLFHPQLNDVADLAREFPEVPIIVNHAGGPLGVSPYDREKEFGNWASKIEKLSECRNVYMKLGGITMPFYSGYYWHKQEQPPSSEQLAEDLSPYYEFCINSFGAERCMFESNFPVDAFSCDYTVLWNAFKIMTQDRSHIEREKLFRTTAETVYRIA